MKKIILFQTLIILSCSSPTKSEANPPVAIQTLMLIKVIFYLNKVIFFLNFLIWGHAIKYYF